MVAVLMMGDMRFLNALCNAPAGSAHLLPFARHHMPLFQHALSPTPVRQCHGSKEVVTLILQGYCSLLAGKSGVDQISRFDASEFPTKFAAQIKDFSSDGCASSPKRAMNNGRHRTAMPHCTVLAQSQSCPETLKSCRHAMQCMCSVQTLHESQRLACHSAIHAAQDQLTAAPGPGLSPFELRSAHLGSPRQAVRTECSLWGPARRLIEKKSERRFDNCIKYTVVASKKALAHAGLSKADDAAAFEALDEKRVGVLVGSGMGGLQVFQDGVESLVQKARSTRVNLVVRSRLHQELKPSQ